MTTTEQEIADKLAGFYAYDTGATDSGIKDDELRKQIKDEMRSWAPDKLRVFIGVFLREAYLSDEALNEGYGPEDVQNFMAWLEWDFGVVLE